MMLFLLLDVVKVYDLTGHVKCLDCQTSQLVFDCKLDTIGILIFLSLVCF